MLFGEMALSLHFITQGQLDECLAVQRELRRHGVEKSLGAIMHDRNYLDMLQVREIMEALDRPEEVRHSIPGYEMVRLLGKGTMGSVYEGEHLADGQRVAVKVLSPALADNPQYLRRFMREAEVASRIAFPGIVRFFETGHRAGYHYLIMELVEGHGLDVLLTRGPMPEAAALHIARGVACSLDHIHSLGMVHRDIKPANIIIASDGNPKLCDLGLTKSMSDPSVITRHGTILGTPFYISPEQATGKDDIDIRTDIYSLGATLYHVVTGDPPFLGRNPREIIQSLMDGHCRAPRLSRPDLSAATDALILEMMEKDPDRRPRLPSDVVARIDDIFGKGAAGDRGSPLSRLKGWLGLKG